MNVEQDHEMKATLHIDVIVPGHAARGAATALFHLSRLELIEREGGRCWVSNATAEESGAPLEAHHYPIERCFAEKIDWSRFAQDALAGHWGPYAQAFDWRVFFGLVEHEMMPLDAEPVDVYRFVDDMTVNGRLLAKQFHTGSDGIHVLPEPIHFARKYMIEGYTFAPGDIVHHFDACGVLPVPVLNVGNGNPPPPDKTPPPPPK